MARKGKSVFALNPRLLTCALCPATFFQNHSQHKYCDGCRDEGRKLKMQEWANNNRESLREYSRRQYRKNAAKICAKTKAYAKTESGRRMRATCEANQRIRNPHKIAARQMVRCAIVCGVLVKKACERCENSKAEAHHDDYTKPLEVKWLCHRCHRIRHQELGDGGFGYGNRKRTSNGKFAAKD